MIDINLSPPELRKGKKRSLLPGGFNIPKEVVIGSVGGLFILLIFVHIILLFTNITRISKHKSLKKEWEIILPSKTNVDKVINEMRVLEKSFESVTKITGQDSILWSEKLNMISDVMPRGVWLRRMSFDEDIFFIEGSAIARQQNEMVNVHQLTSRLKNNEKFLDGLEDLELGSIQRRSVKTLEIADFLITIKRKREKEDDEDS